MRPGLWLRAGEAAVIVGLNWTGLLGLIPPACDRERVVALLAQYEAGLVEGAAESARHAQEQAKLRAEVEAASRGR